MKKECICLNHFAVHQKLIQHCKSTILQLKKINKIKKKEFLMEKAVSKY